MNQLKIEKKEFGTTADNITIYQYVLSNENGMEVSIINYGGIITSLKAKDRNGKYQDIVLGFNSLPPYEDCLLYTSPSPRDGLLSRMPSSA